MVKIGQNTEKKRPGDQMRLAITQIPVRNHQLMLMRKTLKGVMAAQNSAIRTNHIKVRIDKTQKNSKCRLCGDRDETINHIISECSKLAQKKYKTRHDWVGKVINRETCKKFKFDRTNKWYMHNPAPVLIRTHINSYWTLTYTRIT